MKYLKYFYLLLIVAIAGYWLIYFVKRDSVGKGTDAETKIIISKKIINNGATKQHVPVTANFEITNVGEHPLLISNVETDCNCTAPDWIKEPVLPKHKTTIKLVYNAATLGYYQKKAMVRCNVDDSPILLILRGNINK